MTEDYFWGLTLDKDKKSEVWDPEVKSGSADVNESQGMRGEHTLLVKQVVLSPDAKAGEVNVVEVEAMGYKSDVSFPVAVMTGGGNHQATLDLLFPDPPVTFRLVRGTGPITLLGNHTVGTGELVGEDDDEDDLDDDIDEEDIDDLEESPTRNNIEEKKRKVAQANANQKNKGKKQKLDEK